MGIVGLGQGDGSVLVGVLSDDSAEVAVMAEAEAFWRRRGCISR